MSEKDKQELENEEQLRNEDAQGEEPETTEEGNEENDTPEGSDEVTEAKQELGEMKDKYLRLYSEFENYRRRTSKEKLEFMQSANADLIRDLLPVLDDFERAKKSMETAPDVESVKEGIELVYGKFLKTLQGKGLKAMSAEGDKFDPELHEAVTQIPAPSEDMKGKVVDEIEKGYYLNDKVIRFAKVVTGA